LVCVHSIRAGLVADERRERVVAALRQLVHQKQQLRGRLGGRMRRRVLRDEGDVVGVIGGDASSVHSRMSGLAVSRYGCSMFLIDVAPKEQRQRPASAL